MKNRNFHEIYFEICVFLAAVLVAWVWGLMTHMSWCRTHHMPTDRYHRTATEAVRR